ncbi:G2/mitotic-specific cyclin-B3-like [Patiria miniata]|uniref:G2/mitotic-specific cyclin-B3 n=1 Tax=Patiria miniata TaxID=46514 RepID=A0A913ZGN3_PATMI|nr:G2/mitotic-specific cyclin-B3-like [Patiria miniata]XP_038050583.1 G2/mitotic-specific cyclin-B3-like [Patiria miniata]XP_038050584.1 G2/mitotic-specific cyclin-B3-like [Patiria miniata]
MPLAMRRKPKMANIQQIHHDEPKGPALRQSKRRSSGSPKGQQPTKRAAFGDITNAKLIRKEGTKKVNIVSSKKSTTAQQVPKMKEPLLLVKPKTDTVTHPVTHPVTDTQPEAQDESLEIILSQGSSQDSSQDSLPSSQESSSSSHQMQSSSSSSPESVDLVELMNQRNDEKTTEADIKDAVAAITLQESPDYNDIDEENKGDPNQSPIYAQDIFNYLKERELRTPIESYFDQQPEVNRHMRAVLVDWLVEVQENFELNHETLYLAVKLVDRYLMKKKVTRDILQLLGATSLFIACKYDERCPPALDDFKYICDDAYERQQFIDTEMVILSLLDFDLGIPLSYRFLRRYAKCAHASMETLTLARFILEQSLMDAQFLETRDSMIAAAALLLAFKMTKTGEWDATLQHYSGYKESELMDLTRQLNSMLAATPNKQLMTIRNKYSHKVFYEVAKLPALDVLQL